MKTLSKIRERFYWDRLRADVDKWCRECHACGARKGPKTRTKGRLQRYNVGAPFESAMGPEARPIFSGIGFRTRNPPSRKPRPMPLGHRGL
ncbi:hypothetical protein AVEN_124796-1 [Araneus ventricosus]|uniref:Integrase zinc-binding domain-containing protein n=1 Tax=Araneus ventricosus TaxID=182803 RepID=A0A4Y2MGJ5_ARAVE|nr:hypothetical protein AVEN_124796-1 [Araneus ventricosus]